MELLMQYSRSGGHPLHVTGTDHATGTGRIAMGDLALIDNGDRLEPAMRVYTHATRLFARLELSGRRVVQQQDGPHVPPTPLVIEQGTHGEAVTHRAGARCAGDPQRPLHTPLPGSRAVDASHGNDAITGPASPVDHDILLLRPMIGRLRMRDLNDLYCFV